MLLDATPITENRALLPLLIMGLALLALGVLAAGWDPVELPMGLVALGAATAVLLGPEPWRGKEALEATNCLVLASLITLVGFQVMA
ncbi:hypothetical protein [Halomonas sp. JS92-SW72]|uniref:hypothetical protein n=1 Tax=Halomonas sp. JS92-SW72 TaxID=2306583 RepID=UPI000E5A9AA4|nr:hypothetical protein [Halomonas sp. JS92-SW72]AXY41757.1 hypothetical protein D1793_05855 [Halomonas sp. JS92-SW72]